MLALICKYVAKIAMQAETKLKPYKTWESALAFLQHIKDLLPRDDRWCLCQRCWVWCSALASYPYCETCGNMTRLFHPNMGFRSWGTLVKQQGTEGAARQLRALVHECQCLAARREKKKKRQSAIDKKKTATNASATPITSRIRRSLIVKLRLKKVGREEEGAVQEHTSSSKEMEVS
jgi:hypothetical protein